MSSQTVWKPIRIVWSNVPFRTSIPALLPYKTCPFAQQKGTLWPLIRREIVSIWSSDWYVNPNRSWERSVLHVMPFMELSVRQSNEKGLNPMTVLDKILQSVWKPSPIFDPIGHERSGRFCLIVCGCRQSCLTVAQPPATIESPFDWQLLKAGSHLMADI